MCWHHVPGTLSASVSGFYDKNRDEASAAEERIRGKIVLTDGFASPNKVLEFQEKGAVGVIAVNPGVDRHWGICSSVWGTPDLDGLPRKPVIPVAVVNNPDGQELIELAKAGGTRHHPHAIGGRLVQIAGASGQRARHYRA